MNNLSGDLNGILGIELMPAPHTNWESLLVSTIGLLVILVVAIIIYTRYISAHGKFKKKLRKLYYKFEQQQINSHDTAFQLANMLKQSLHVHTLSNDTELPKHLLPHQARWNTLIQHLCNARYSPNEYPNNEMLLLFSDVNFFLRRWP